MNRITHRIALFRINRWRDGLNSDSELEDERIVKKLAKLGRKVEAYEVAKWPIDGDESRQPVYGIFDPDYAIFLSKARCVAKMEGYALAVHGSFSRDLDVIAVPWTPEARSPINLIMQIEYRTGLKRQAEEATVMNHGRLQWTLMLPGFEDPRYIDFSVMHLSEKA